MTPQTKWSRDKIDIGLCAKCGREPRGDYSMCVSCRGKAKNRARSRYRERIKSGICTSCGKTRDGTGAYCTTCWMKFHSQQFKVDLSKLKFDRCPYFGVKLVPYFNMELDHIVPQSRGGKTELGNLQWVSQLANQMKGDMTHEEFISACKEIVCNHA